MPAKDSLNVSMTPEARADLARILELGLAGGQDFTYERLGGRREHSEAKVVHWALSLASGRLRPPGATQAFMTTPNRPTDADRVGAAMKSLRWSSTELAEAAGCSAGHVRAVLSGRTFLGPAGKLGRWLAAWEAGR